VIGKRLKRGTPRGSSVQAHRFDEVHLLIFCRNRIGQSICLFSLIATAAFGQQGASAKDSFCRFGSRVFVDPGHHPATALARTSVSCRVYYEDGAFPDGWAQGFMVTSAETEDKVKAAAKRAPPPGKYTCGVFLSGNFTFTQYVTLTAGSYDSSIAGNGRQHYDVAQKRLLFDSGKFRAFFGSYEPTSGYPMFRLMSREDIKESEHTRAWRSQVCSGKYCGGTSWAFNLDLTAETIEMNLQSQGLNR